MKDTKPTPAETLPGMSRRQFLNTAALTGLAGAGQVQRGPQATLAQQAQRRYQRGVILLPGKTRCHQDGGLALFPALR